jgi:hypothetical protein
MNRINKYIALLLLPMLLSFAPDWATFTSADKDFSILFPEPPKETDQKLETAIGNLVVKMYTSEASENEVYMLMTTDYPETSNISSDADTSFLSKLFRGAIDGGIQNLGDGVLMSEENISLSGFPGREFKISFMDGEGLVHGRVYLAGRRMYMIQIVGAKENASTWEVARFMNSFTISKK